MTDPKVRVVRTGATTPTTAKIGAMASLIATTPQMQDTATKALEHSDATNAPGWVQNFARTVTVGATSVRRERVAEWFENNPGEETSITGQLLGGVDGKRWAAPPAQTFDDQAEQWSGVLCFEGVETSDGRKFRLGALEWRELPLTLQDQIEKQDQHAGAIAVGPINRIWRGQVNQGQAPIYGAGTFDETSEGQAARLRMRSGSKVGVSVDITEARFDLPDDPEELEEALFGGEPLEIVYGKVSAATLVSIPAFEGARLRIAVDDHMSPEALVASGGVIDGTVTVTVPLDPVFAQSEPPAIVGMVDDGHNQYSTQLADALIASGAGVTRPPSTWFAKRDYTEPAPFTVEPADSNGLRKVHGYAGLRSSCHIGFPDRCVDIPMGLDYDSFQGPKAAGQVNCSDNVRVHAGPLIMSTEHAAIRDGNGRRVPAGAARDHYAHTSCLVGQIRCYEDRHGLQVQGWLLPGVTDEQVAVLDAADVSPDWRPRATANQGRGGRGVVAMLVVNVSGYNTALTASAGTGAETETETETETDAPVSGSTGYDGDIDAVMRGLGIDPNPEMTARLSAVEAALKPACCGRCARNGGACG